MTTVVNVIKQDKTDWHSVNWQKANRIVKNLRRRIFKATRNKEKHPRCYRENLLWYPPKWEEKMGCRC